MRVLEPITNYDAAEAIERATSRNCPRQLADPGRCSFGNLHLRLVATVKLSFSLSTSLLSLSLALTLSIGRRPGKRGGGCSVRVGEPKAGMRGW